MTQSLPTLDPDRARRLMEAAAEGAGADDVRVTLAGGAEALTRFGQNDITQNMARERYALSVQVALGRRTATATGDELTEEAARGVGRRARGLAEHAPEDPEWVEPLGPQEYARVDAFVEETARQTPEARADAVVRALERARRDGLAASGTISTAATATALWNRAGLFAHFAETRAAASVTMRTADGSGSSREIREEYRDAREIDLDRMAALAADRARRSVSPAEIPVGAYKVVLAPRAVADLLLWLGWALDAREADEGRSFFAGKMGRRIMDERVMLRSDFSHPSIRGAPFDAEGRPQRPIPWIERGIVRNLYCTRYWALRQGRDPTPTPASLVLEGQGAGGSVDDLVRGLDRGLLITRFWYIRMVDAKRLLLTGLTRDGTFLVEGGEVRGPVINYRFNDSPIDVLAGVEAFSAPEKQGAMVVPGLRLRAFHLTSPSRAV